MTGFEFEGDSPEDVVDGLERLPSVLGDKLAGAARDIGQRLRGDAAENAPVDTGQLASSIEAVIREGRDEIEVRVGTNREGAAAQEYGADPFMPPPSALRDWARRVLGDADAAYPVARGIAEAGLEAQPYLRPAFEDNEEWAIDRLNQAVKAAFAEVGLA